MHEIIIGPYFFMENTISGNTYLDMLELYDIPQLPDRTIFQQDGIPPCFANDVHIFLDNHFPAGRTFYHKFSQMTDLHLIFSCGDLLKIRCTVQKFVIWQKYGTEFMLQSIMSHQRYLATHEGR